MKPYYILFITFFLITSCKEDEEQTPFYPKDYGNGLYVTTSSGVSFYDGNVVKNQIFQNVNGFALNNLRKIKFKNNSANILSNNILYKVDHETFEFKGSINGFVDAVDFEFVNPDNRIFVVDKGDSKIKAVDIQRLEITSDIETGQNTLPVSIVIKSYNGTGRAIIMNGGGAADSLKDSTIVAIDYKDELVPIADNMGSLNIGDNPNSAVHINNLKVLCKGIYDPNDLTNKTTSRLVTLNAWQMLVTASKDLAGVFNANNLTSNNNGTEYYFTAEDGFYKMDNNGNGLTSIPVVTDVLHYHDEIYSQYSPTDSTTYYYNRDILYINDSQNSKNTIYKYNVNTGNFIDTITVNGNVRDIIFY
jgi:hypothetical protein